MREEGISAFFFFFNDTATTEIYTLSLHDALPISVIAAVVGVYFGIKHRARRMLDEIVLDLAPLEARLRREIENAEQKEAPPRSEEHTSELQSRQYLVCRLLLEKKIIITQSTSTFI